MGGEKPNIYNTLEVFNELYKGNSIRLSRFVKLCEEVVKYGKTMVVLPSDVYEEKQVMAETQGRVEAPASETRKAVIPPINLGHKHMKKLNLMKLFVMAVDEGELTTAELIAERCIDYCYDEFIGHIIAHSEDEIVEVLSPELKHTRRKLLDDDDEGDDDDDDDDF